MLRYLRESIKNILFFLLDMWPGLRIIKATVSLKPAVATYKLINCGSFALTTVEILYNIINIIIINWYKKKKTKKKKKYITVQRF